MENNNSRITNFTDLQFDKIYKSLDKSKYVFQNFVSENPDKLVFYTDTDELNITLEIFFNGNYILLVSNGKKCISYNTDYFKTNNKDNKGIFTLSELRHCEKLIKYFEKIF